MTGLLDDAAYDDRLMGRMYRDTGRVAAPAWSDQRQALSSAGRSAAGLAYDMLVPQTPTDFALMAAGGPGARMLRLPMAAGLLAADSNPAEAAIVRRAADAARGIATTEGYRPVFPQPQRMMPPGEQTPGGRYLEAPTRDPGTGQMSGVDITGQTRAGTRIEIGPNGAPRMVVSPEAAAPATAAQGNVVRSNLFRREAGWDWVGAPPPGVPADGRFLVSVQPTSGQHVYALSTDFENAVNMARYPRAQSEPRLRPTTHGDVELGNEVGRISVRGVEHPVYDRVFVFNRDPAQQPQRRPRRRGTIGVEPAE